MIGLLRTLRARAVWAFRNEGGYVALIGLAVAVVAAGAGAYLQSEAAADANRQQKRSAELQADAEQKQGEAARKNARMRAERHLRSQASKAGGAGVVAGEGSLLALQMEAGSLAQYEEDLAAFGHEIRSNLHGFEAKLFGRQARINSSQSLTLGLLAAGGTAGAGAGKLGGSGKTAATQESNFQIGSTRD